MSPAATPLGAASAAASRRAPATTRSWSLLHTALLVGCVVEVLGGRPAVPAWLGWPMLALVVAAQALRWWCIRTLGPQWNTRVVVVPGLPLVDRGPYRWLRHPNYVAVVVEGVALPLVHTAWITAVVFTVLNARAAGACGSGCRERGARAAGDRRSTRAGDRPAGRRRRAGRAGRRHRGRARRAARSWSSSRGPAPIDKACGEGLMPGGARALRALGRRAGRARVPRHPLRRRRGRRADARFRAGPGLGVRRTTLHAALGRARPTRPASSASHGGVGEVAPGRATASARPGSPAALAGRRRRAALAGAPRARPAARARPGRPRATGCAGTTRSRRGPTCVEVHWSARAEAYVTPVAPTRGRRRRPRPRRGRRFDELLAAFPRAAGAAGRRRPASRRARRRAAAAAAPARRVAGRVLLVGDAAGLRRRADRRGARGGAGVRREQLVRCVVEGRPQEYERAWRGPRAATVC